MWRLLLILTLLIASGFGANAFPPKGSSGTASFGPGSPGFLATCSSTFAFTNNLLQSQTFTTSPWATAGNIAAPPTVTPNTTTAPDSTMTASTLALPAVSGVNARSLLSQQVTVYAPFQYTADIYVKGVVGGESLWFSATASGVTYSRVLITATTSWQRVTFALRPASDGAQYFQIGVDLRDGGQSAKSAQSVYIWGAQLVGGNYEATYIPTTTVAVTQNQTENCPAGVAFRDFAPLTYAGFNPIIPQNTASYNAGGVAGPFMSSVKIGSTYYSFTNCTVAGANRDNWVNHCLYSSTALTGSVWTPDPGNPLITTTASTWKDHYMLHGVLAPTCTVDVYCFYVSAMNTGAASSIGLLTAPDITGPWTGHPSNPVVSVTEGGIHNASPSLPGMIRLGSDLYMCTSVNNNQGQYLVSFKSPVSDGVTWAFESVLLEPPLATDWDTNSYGIIDCHIFLNNRGFYEMAYSAILPNGRPKQEIGYAVSLDGKRWWKRQDAPIIVTGGSAYPGVDWIGDFAFYQNGGTFYAFANYDNTTNLSEGFVSTMPDH